MGDRAGEGLGADECGFILFSSFVLIFRLRSHGAKTDFTYFFITAYPLFLFEVSESAVGV
jgi:hypothetical protein